jgi:hypothetical protein
MSLYPKKMLKRVLPGVTTTCICLKEKQTRRKGSSYLKQLRTVTAKTTPMSKYKVLFVTMKTYYNLILSTIPGGVKDKGV